MAGKSATMYDPSGEVSRADMAVILVNMLAQASPTVTIDKSGNIKLGAAGTDEADDYFPDVRATQPRATDARISAAYELGITMGTTMAPERAGQTYAGLLTSFDPNSPVNRGEMAAFIHQGTESHQRPPRRRQRLSGQHRRHQGLRARRRLQSRQRRQARPLLRGHRQGW